MDQVGGHKIDQSGNHNQASVQGPVISAAGGRGGDSDGGPAGDGGGGGTVIMTQLGKEFTPEGITIYDIKNPHQQYWRFLTKIVVLWAIRNVWKIIVGVVIVGVATWLWPK